MSHGSHLKNVLGSSSSPYLRLHAKNPIAWQEFSQKTLDIAKKEGKVVLISVGYAACHWCHVMAHESFESDEFASFLNKHFVSIKVDREQRPDVDRMYMSFVQETTGSGGWPLTVFATPDGKPFYGGTYYPPKDAYGRPGFGTLIRRVQEMWSTDAASIREHAATAAAALAAPRPAASADATSWSSLSPTVLRQVAGSFDRVNGGFSKNGPKFPRPVTLELLTALVGGGASPINDRTGQPPAPPSTDLTPPSLDTRLFLSLSSMTRLGLADHVAGGFHRYTVDEAWAIPHFEKMLYDNAQLGAVLVSAVTRYGQRERGREGEREVLGEGDRFAEVLRGTCEYLLRELALPGGGLASAQDAEATPEDEDEAARLGHGEKRTVEGAHWVWTEAEIRRILGKEETFAANPTLVDAFVSLYQVAPDGNAPDGTDPHGYLTGKNHLRRLTPESAASLCATLSLSPADLETAATVGLGALAAHRSANRSPPLLDDKVIYSWNCQAAGMLMRAGAVLGEERFIVGGRQVLAFLGEKLTREDGRLLRSWRAPEAGDATPSPSPTLSPDIPAFAEDYGAAALALLDAFDVTSEPRYLAAARQRLADAHRLFWDDENGGFYATGADVADMDSVLRLKEDYDGAEAAGGSLLALAAVRAAGWEEGEGAAELRETARRTLASFGDALVKAPITVPLAATAAWLLDQPPLHCILVVGSSEEAERRRDELLSLLRRSPLPRYAYVLAVPAAHLTSPPPHPPPSPSLSPSLTALIPWLADSLPPLEDKTDGVALCVCAGFSCRRPAVTDEEVKQVLESL